MLISFSEILPNHCNKRINFRPNGLIRFNSSASVYKTIRMGLKWNNETFKNDVLNEVIFVREFANKCSKQTHSNVWKQLQSMRISSICEEILNKPITLLLFTIKISQNICDFSLSQSFNVSNSVKFPLSQVISRMLNWSTNSHISNEYGQKEKVYKQTGWKFGLQRTAKCAFYSENLVKKVAIWNQSDMRIHFYWISEAVQFQTFRN